MRNISSTFGLLHDNGLVCRPDKCILGVSQVEFLGHIVSNDGIRPNSTKVEAIERFPRPTTVKGVQEFLGLVNYYGRFVPNAAGHLAPLYDAIAGRNKDFVWTDACTSAFEDAKSALAHAATLSYPVPGQPISLTTDASNVAVGACLEQTINGYARPIAFFSRKLRSNERKYSTFDRELLAIYLALRHFRHFIDGSNAVTVKTDHKPIIHALSKTSDAWTGRQQRHLSAIAETGCTIQHLPGKQNPVADALSRAEIDAIYDTIEINGVVLGVDYTQMAKAQATDPETNSYRTSITSLKWKEVKFGDSTLLCDVSTGRPRPLVPHNFRRQVFEAVHSLSHPSVRSTVKMVKDRFVWHKINRDVRSWVRLRPVNARRLVVTRSPGSVVLNNHGVVLDTST